MKKVCIISVLEGWRRKVVFYLGAGGGSFYCDFAVTPSEVICFCQVLEELEKLHAKNLKLDSMELKELFVQEIKTVMDVVPVCGEAIVVERHDWAQALSLSPLAWLGEQASIHDPSNINPI